MRILTTWTRRTVLASLVAAGTMMSADAALADRVKVAGIFTQSVEQQWINRIHIALQAAEKRGEIEYVYSENVANTDYEQAMRAHSEAGQHLIVGEIFDLERAARKVAADYPDTAFLMGSSFRPLSDNLSVFDNFTHEPAYFSGMAAGAASKSNVIGMVGGFATPEVNRLMNAFMEGARETNPEVKFLVAFIDSWYDPAKAKDSALAMMDVGADVMYGERFGVSDAAVERGVIVVGNVVDTSSEHPATVLPWATWHMGQTIDYVIAAVAAGTYKGQDYSHYSYLPFDGGSNAVNAALVLAIAAQKASLMDGSFKVTVNVDAPVFDK